LLEAEFYRISAIRSKFEQNNLSIAESFWVADWSWMPSTPCAMDRELPDLRDIQSAVALPIY
jgi:hypothetical protein